MTTTLITGANRSLGLETARRLVDAGLPELDVLVNNAGVLGTSYGLDDLDVAGMTTVLGTNVVGIVRVTGAALPLLLRSSNAVIVNVASGVGWPRFLQDPDHDEYPVRSIPYAASKAAVIALTVQYAKNLPAMRVNASDPGYTATEFNGYSGHQTVTEGTDATVALATIGQDGPTGEFRSRHGRVPY